MKTRNKVDADAKRRVRAGRLLRVGTAPPEVAKLVGLACCAPERLDQWPPTQFSTLRPG